MCRSEPPPPPLCVFKRPSPGARLPSINYNCPHIPVPPTPSKASSLKVTAVPGDLSICRCPTSTLWNLHDERNPSPRRSSRRWSSALLHMSSCHFFFQYGDRARGDAKSAHINAVIIIISNFFFFFCCGGDKSRMKLLDGL